MILRAKQFEFVFPRPALVMGVVNVTPDSFSDGGEHATTEAAIEHGIRLVENGAEILDVGGESTRPSAGPVSEKEELSRVLPVIEGLAKKITVPISVDTTKPGVAWAAVEAGATIINDIAASRTNESMWRVPAETGAAYVVMHMHGSPETMQKNPTYKRVAAEVGVFFGERMQALSNAGVKPEQIILDVGIGFGKALEHNLQLLAELRSFTRWQRPLLVGVSRKSFIGRLVGAEVTERLPGSLAGACWAVSAGANILRVHDVAATRQAIKMTEAIMAVQKK